MDRSINTGKEALVPLPSPLLHWDVLQHKNQGVLSQECWTLKGWTAQSEAGSSLGSPSFPGKAAAR